MVEDSNNSLLAAIGGIIAPIFAPLGFGEWQPWQHPCPDSRQRSDRIHDGSTRKCSWRHRRCGKRCAGRCGMVPDSHRSILLPAVQPAGFPMSCSNRNNGTADAVQKMVLVCDFLPERICIPGMLKRIPDRKLRYGRSLRNRTAAGFLVAIIFLILLFRPDPYKNQKVYTKTSVQAAG